jgi:Leucine-rich repeat (LRR) protein
LGGLGDLDLGDNQLKSLPTNLFVNTPKLTAIDFEGNKIEAASSKMFQPIINNNFEYGCFSDNTKIDAHFLKKRLEVPES